MTMEKQSPGENAKNSQNLLVKKARHGDVPAFVELLGHYSGLICSKASSFGLPKDEFEDLCQEGRLALYRAVITYDENTAEFSTYAGSCIRNSMISWAKKVNRDAKVMSAAQTGADSEGVSAFETSVTDDSVHERAAAESLLDELLNSDKAGLSDYERKAIGLKIAGFGTAEISGYLGKSAKSVENTLFRARTKLKKYLERRA